MRFLSLAKSMLPPFCKSMVPMFQMMLTFETATIQDSTYKHPLLGTIVWVLVTVRLLPQQTAGMILTPRISQKAAGADILRIRRAPSRRSHPRLVFILLTGNSFWRLEMRHALFCGHPFLPERWLVLKEECYEVLLGVIARYEKEEKPVESGYGDYKHNMAEVLYDDVIMFRSMIKRAVQEAVPSGYALYAPPSVATQEACITFVKDRATLFLKDSEYLMGEPNEQGKRLNFGHLVLKQVCLLVYYPKTSKSLRNFPEFQDAVPRKALALVAAMVHFVLTLYKNHGKDINPNIISKDLEGAYNKFMGSMQKLNGHHSKGQRFKAMLAQWADEGM
ncbi:hypothetical protein JVT61DRAFT_3310 [Boletus reticuloceps]|uniref:DUF6532 domain-containing protein n=1 Tax=Boletus reticuloceps TaxID=495285 RepID=A0A8I2YN42_9AGAM|nr:hypothetical protein JVT61DRAFT_3310 [Boletus reticuloceps]